MLVVYKVCRQAAVIVSYKLVHRSNPSVIYVTNIRWYQNMAQYIVVKMWPYTVPQYAPDVFDTKSTVNIVHKNCRYKSTLNRIMALLIW